jgi:hypothetical protein
MSDYDKLPRAVRAALADADHNWSGTQALREMRKPKAKRRAQCMNAAAMVATIREADAKQHRQDAERGIVCGGQR